LTVNASSPLWAYGAAPGILGVCVSVGERERERGGGRERIARLDRE